MRFLVPWAPEECHVHTHHTARACDKRSMNIHTLSVSQEPNGMLCAECCQHTTMRHSKDNVHNFVNIITLHSKHNIMTRSSSSELPFCLPVSWSQLAMAMQCEKNSCQTSTSLDGVFCAKSLTNTVCAKRASDFLVEWNKKKTVTYFT